MSDPLFVERNGQRTWLKWHRGRRRVSDPAFTGARIREALRLGASVEVDLVIHGSNGCAILHDLTLDRETTGSGPVRDHDAATLRQLHLRGNNGESIDQKVMLLEDLCALLADEAPHPEALLQLDFKEEHSALGPETIAGFAAATAPVAGSLILSGADMGAIDMLAKAVPGLRTGYDPCYGAGLARLQKDGDFGSFIAEALAFAPGADFIYLDYQIVLAAEEKGVDVVAPIHAAGRKIDAWTIRQVDATTLPQVETLLALGVDQITTDDPEGLYRALGT